MKNDTLIQLQILYEIAMGIGNSLDLHKMLKGSLTTYLKKLSCTSGVIFRMVSHGKSHHRFVPQCAIPRNASRGKSFIELIKNIPEKLTTTELNLFLASLPFDGTTNTGQRFHVMELVGFGLLILIKSGDGLDKNIIKSLSNINQKLADSAIACLQKETIEQINEKLSRQILIRQEAEKAKGQFLANMSHEILTPLNGIVWLNRLLLDSELTDEQQELLTYLDTSTTSLLKVLKALFVFSKLEAGELEFKEVDFNIQKLLSDVVGDMMPKAKMKNLDLSFRIDPGTAVFVKGDPHRVRQILTYLIGNAIKFTHKGRVMVALGPKGQTQEGIGLECLVTDTGIGIPIEKMDLLFENFTQSDESDTRQYQGTGLGLGISRKLIQLMGGQISASNNKEGGAAFKFSIALKYPDNDHALENQGQATMGISVLIVDDNPINRKVIQVLCQRLGWRSDSANDGKQAIHKLTNKNYDLVFMDCQMPEMDGYEATKIIRDPNSVVKNHEIPIIAVTANISPENRDKCLEIGMDGFIPKPFNLLALLKSSQKILKIKI